MTSNFDFVPQDNGATTLKQLSTGEIMHSSIGPVVEARKIYVEQSGLESKLQNGANTPLVIYDLGLGVAANAVESIRCALNTQGRRRAHLISFENDLGGIMTALDHLDRFSFLRDFVAPLRALLSVGHFECADYRWDLVQGDFLKTTLQAFPLAEIIYHDFYTPNRFMDFWGFEVFNKLAKASSEDCVLTTYSAATWVRSALTLAGFHVGFGASTILKNETTVASKNPKLVSRPLDARWLERFNCSTKGLPPDWPQEREKEARTLVETRVHSLISL